MLRIMAPEMVVSELQTVVCKTMSIRGNFKCTTIPRSGDLVPDTVKEGIRLIFATLIFATLSTEFCFCYICSDCEYIVRIAKTIHQSSVKRVNLTSG